MYYSVVMNIYDYTTSGGKNLIIDYIESLPIPVKTEILVIRQLISNKGIEADSVFFLNICKKQKQVKVVFGVQA